ncbi:DUF551 domain-containing protein [Enterobacter hormaechei]
MKTFTIGWLNKCRCGNKSHTVKTSRGNDAGLWDDDAVKCNSCGRGGVIQVCEGQARVLWETDEEMAEGKPMSTITKQWLQQKIADMEAARDEIPFGLGEDGTNTLAALHIALASLEAEAVAVSDDMAYAFHHALSDSSLGADEVEEIKTGLRAAFANVTAPPAPVSVPAAMEMDDDFDSAFEHGKAVGWNAYRAAMLQSFGNSEQLNSPVIPDGWVACSERMPDIDTEIFYFCKDDGLRDCGIVSSSNFSDSGDAQLYVHAEGYDLRLGVDITHWMPLPAAPQQEVK